MRSLLPWLVRPLGRGRPWQNRPMPDPRPTGRQRAAVDPVPIGSPATERTRLRRLPDQGSHRSEDLHAVLDAGFVCHLGLVVDGRPDGGAHQLRAARGPLYLHGSVASRSLRAAQEPVPVCVTVTLIDGVVLARSVFNHSVNYRCAMVYGLPEVLADDEKAGRAPGHQRPGGPGAVGVRPVALGQGAGRHHRAAPDPRRGSVKVSEGPPDDGDGPDGALDVWAGEIPLRTVRLDPVADPALRAGIAVPDHLPDGRTAPGVDAVARTSTGSDGGSGHRRIASVSRGSEASGAAAIPWAAATGS